VFWNDVADAAASRSSAPRGVRTYRNSCAYPRSTIVIERCCATPPMVRDNEVDSRPASSFRRRRSGRTANRAQRALTSQEVHGVRDLLQVPMSCCTWVRFIRNSIRFFRIRLHAISLIQSFSGAESLETWRIPSHIRSHYRIQSSHAKPNIGICYDTGHGEWVGSRRCSPERQ
jgi:hypothetical protein